MLSPLPRWGVSPTIKFDTPLIEYSLAGDNYGKEYFEILCHDNAQGKEYLQENTQAQKIKDLHASYTIICTIISAADDNLCNSYIEQTNATRTTRLPSSSNSEESNIKGQNASNNAVEVL